MILFENAQYEVRQIPDALDEDNSGRRTGYGIFNKMTGVREATGLVLPECRWRAEQFMRMDMELNELSAVVEPIDPDTFDNTVN